MINFKHLHYFQQVAELGGVTRASRVLHVSPQAISMQLAELEERLGVELFARVGRSLQLTDTGRMVLRYAQDIFTTGAELEAVLRDQREQGRTPELRVGVSDSLAKTVAFRLLEPALTLSDPIRLICREGPLERLLSALALHELDLVLADQPVPAAVSVRAYAHRLGRSHLAFFASPRVRAAHPGAFPACLDGAPLLVPGAAAATRPLLRAWLARTGVQPQVVGEFDDAALAQAFAERDQGFCLAPAVVGKVLERQSGLCCVGIATGVQEDYYALSIERRITHRGVVAITEAARTLLEEGGADL